MEPRPQKGGLEEITAHIPHRPPFLFIDQVEFRSPAEIRTVKRFHPDEPFFSGHYPGNPIVPGVILCEAIFQSGAILVSCLLENPPSGTPVLTRINNVSLKKIVRPGDEIKIHVELIKRFQEAFFLKGTARVRDRLAVSVEFACTRVET